MTRFVEIGGLLYFCVLNIFYRTILRLHKNMFTFQFRNELDIEPIDLKSTVIDMAYSLIDGGFVKKTSKYKGRPGTPV